MAFKWPPNFAFNQLFEHITSVRHAFTQSHSFFSLSLSYIESSTDLNTNFPLQNFGGFYWCVSRTKCCFSHEIGTRSQSGRRFQSIQIRYSVYIGYYLWWVCVNLKTKNHFTIRKNMRCGLLKWWIFESIFKKLETAMGQSIDAQSQGDSEYVKAVYKLVAND